MIQKIAFVSVVSLALACTQVPKKEKAKSPQVAIDEIDQDTSEIDRRLAKYVSVDLKADLSDLSENQKKMISILIEVGDVMDDLFWREAYGDKSELLGMLSDQKVQKFAEINYGPWDRLAGNQTFVEGFGKKPLGANFYPKDMTKEEFKAADIADKNDLYTLIRRDSNGQLMSIPYHEAFEKEVKKAADLLKEAAKYAENEDFKKYLKLRAEALLTDRYYESDIAWLNMVDNPIDIICGPIENYEDQLFGYKTAHEAYILLKDMEWSKRLEKYASMLPELQKSLPVDEKYKSESPGTSSQLAAFDVIYYAGDCNAGSKTIAVNLPNDEEVQLEHGTRRSQLKNAMRAKFDKILVPISKELLHPKQQQYINFDAFFSNTMFHEVAHGLGIKNTINDKGTVRSALKDHFSALEEGKADILGLYMVKQLHDKGEIKGDLKSYYTTFIASIFRSVRFGASSAHGKANMIRFNYFKSAGVISRDENGIYTINYDKVSETINDLSSLILELQGDGDYQGVAQLVEDKAKIGANLQADLNRLSEAGIPVDVVFNQGSTVLDL